MTKASAPPLSDICVNCKTRPANVNWVSEGGTLAYIHGMHVRWCEFCATTAQLAYANERAAEIPALEEKLRGLK